MDDHDLLRRYVGEGSEPAFRELVRRHLPVVHAAALRQTHGDAHLARDVAQRVFIAFARKAEQVSRQRTIVGWLYSAARIEAARAVRTEIRRRRREQQAAAMNPISSPIVSEEALRVALDEAMTELGDSDREAVLLRFFSGQSFAAIGQALEVSEEAARKRVDRALEKLRETLGRRGVASTASILAGALEAHAAPSLPPALAAAIEAGVCQQLTGTAAISLTAFMSSTKAMTIAAGLLMVAGGVALHDRAAWRQAMADRAAATEKSPRPAATAVTAASTGGPSGRAETPAQPRIEKSPTGAAAPAYLSNPDYRRLEREAALRRFHLEFQRLYRELNLTPEQVARFEAIMARQDEAKLDAAIARAEGGDEQAVYRQSGAEWSGAMTTLLGPEGFKYLQDYLRARPVRAFIDNYAVQSATMGAAVTPEQADRLATLALANDAMYRQGRGTDPGTVNWTDVWDPAARFLGDEQLALLQRTVEVWALQKQIALRIKSSSPR